MPMSIAIKRFESELFPVLIARHPRAFELIPKLFFNIKPDTQFGGMSVLHFSISFLFIITAQ